MLKKYLLYLFLLVCLVFAVFPWETVVSSDMDLMNMMAGPSLEHPFGTDSLGRDLLFSFSKALSDSVYPIWAVMFVATLAGYGAAYLLILVSEGSFVWRKISTLCQWIGSLLLSVPLGILVFLFANYLERAGLRSILVALAAFVFFRSLLLVSERFIRDSKLQYWKAHEALGGNLAKRVWVYGLRGSWRNSLLGQLAFHLSMGLSIEAALSYLGFGVQPPKLSFGNILSAHYDQFLKGHLSLLIFTLLALVACYIFPPFLISLAQKRLARDERG